MPNNMNDIQGILNSIALLVDNNNRLMEENIRLMNELQAKEKFTQALLVASNPNLTPESLDQAAQFLKSYEHEQNKAANSFIK